MANANPLYDPGDAISGQANGGALTGCRFVKVAAAKTDGNAVQIAHAGASDAPLGVLGVDLAQNALGPVYGAGFVVRGCASAAISAGAEVQLATGGKLATYSSGRKCGIALEAASADGDLILIRVLP